MRPWKKISSMQLVSDPWLSLRADRCELPNGKQIEPFYVLEEKEWVHVLAVNENDEVLIIRQYRYAANVTCTELPGGVIDDGEDPLNAAKRELREETGYVAECWEQVAAVFANPARQTNRVHIFLARGLKQAGQQELDETEEIAFDFASVDAVKRLIRSGEFSQAMHIASFFLGVEMLSG